jgi:glycosyltransferase involved in cell wall biosynthesis
MGQINDDVTLSLLYSAADVMAVTSRQDNLPQTAIEAQSCGCPLVAFDISGLSDALIHLETGYLAKAFDTDDFAGGVKWVLNKKARNKYLSGNARERALNLWSPDVITQKYTEVYKEAIFQCNYNDNLS